jgi:Holliday junction resolvasome RuvABC endonuclease subunit
VRVGYFAGFDPGSVAMGWAVMDEAGALVDAGVWDLGQKKTPAERREQFAELAADWPYWTCLDAAAVETQYFGKNFQTIFRLAVARGWLEFALAARGVHHIAELNPAAIKSNFTGHGAADKKDMIWHASLYFPSIKTIRKTLQEHVADAIAIAVVGQREAQREARIAESI